MFKRISFIAFVVAFFASCHNKLEVLAPYKESVGVYGLLNQDDSVNYIRIERVYLGEGNAIEMAAIQDSVWFKPGELKVSLQRIRNGAVVSVDNPSSSKMEIVLTEANIITDPGMFNTHELAYRTTHKLYDDSQYKLVIHNNHTGKDFSTDPIGLVGDFSQKMIYTQEGSILYPGYSTVNPVAQGGETICTYQAPLNAGICGLHMLFYYTDSIVGAYVPHVLDMNLGSHMTRYTDGTDKVDLSFSDDYVLDYLIEKIGPAGSTVHHRTADSIKFVMNGAGYDLALYNDVSHTTTLAQTTPTYSNIKGGIGIFSSRRQYTLRKKLSPDCITRLANSHYSCPLRFYGPGHTFLTCQ